MGYIDFSILQAVLEDSRISDAREKLVALILATHAQASGEVSAPISTLASEARMTARGTQKILMRLESAGIIRAEKTTGRHWNRYFLTPPTEHPNPEPRSGFNPERDSGFDIPTPNHVHPNPEPRSGYFPLNVIVKKKTSGNSPECEIQKSKADLFASTEPPKKSTSKPSRKPAAPDAFRELTDSLVAAWSAKYGGNKPTWKRGDFVNLRKLAERLGPEEIKRRFEAFLREGADFFRGHPLGKFVSQCDRWARPGQSAAASAEADRENEELLARLRAQREGRWENE